MNTKQALAERERLAGEIRAAKQAATLATTRIAEINQAAKVLEQQRTLSAARASADRQGRCRGEAGLGGGGPQSRAGSRSRCWSRCRRKDSEEAQREFEQLHRDQFEAFAEHAESLTAEAMEKMAALQDPYGEAYSAWAAARREWNDLARLQRIGAVRTLAAARAVVSVQRSSSAPAASGAPRRSGTGCGCSRQSPRARLAPGSTRTGAR